ncbi:MAG: cyclic nucleotide-binding domain-containing protein [Anaerolineales bacterium]|jgi:CRP-like cAMP-binding protein|nr:cyclic nucleotide-binding domain-containing protein [Anaerolineales bacterium]
MNDLREILQKNPLFVSLSAAEIKSLAAHLKTRSLSAGQILFNLGDSGSEMILVRAGQIAIYMPEPGSPQTGQALRIFKAGEILGEMALIDHLPRSASARAESDCAIASLSIADFRDLLASQPQVAMSVMRGLSGRIRYTTDFIGEIRQWVKRLAEGNYAAIQTPGKVHDTSLSALAADFVRMAAQVQAREEKLKQEVAQLRIQIDEKQRREKATEITESEYFRNLQAKLRAMRAQDEEE